ncbi:hypothetical protein PNF31_26860 [Priestia megaterium]|uniref:hypothetical protein n=1 Tax=Priestia megaterium TaxID=1404 RepID=UPI00234ED5F1|nr:hypothetical protein [Priestia megaterium]MDC7724349.1 hypothetical protein [Priestia megaterium]
MTLEVMVLLAVAILLILLGIYLWTKGSSKEPFWEALFNVIGNILVWDLPVFTTFRAWSVFLWLIGFGTFIIFIWATISNWF